MSDIALNFPLLVMSQTTTAPPSGYGVQEEFRWIVPASATGDWSGSDDSVAIWRRGGWMYLPPQKGWVAFTIDTCKLLFWSGSSWDEIGAGGGGSSTLAGLTDTNVASPTDKRALIYDSDSSKFILSERSIEDLSDVVLASLADQHILVYNASASRWENAEHGFALEDGTSESFHVGIAGSASDIAFSVGTEIGQTNATITRAGAARFASVQDLSGTGAVITGYENSTDFSDDAADKGATRQAIKGFVDDEIADVNADVSANTTAISSLETLTQDTVAHWNGQGSGLDQWPGGTRSFNTDLRSQVKACSHSAFGQLGLYLIRTPVWARDIDGTDALTIEIPYAINTVPASDEVQRIILNIIQYGDNGDAVVDLYYGWNIDVTTSLTAKRWYLLTLTLPVANYSIDSKLEQAMTVNLYRSGNDAADTYLDTIWYREALIGSGNNG